MKYFGTNLSEHGHYLWELNGDSISGRNLNFKDLPFDPEEMPRGENLDKGDVRFYFEKGYSICAIEGSCVDDRGGTRSVFFVNETLTEKELYDLIKATPIAMKIISQFPFKVDWGIDIDNGITKTAEPAKGRMVLLGVAETIGELKELIKNYDDNVSFGFRNQPMQRLYEVEYPDDIFVVFQ